MTKRQWMKDLPAYAEKSVSHEVGGKLLKFHPLCADILFMMRGLTGPLAKGLTLLFSGAASGNKDQAVRQKTMNNVQTGENMGFVETDAVPVDIMQERYRQRGEVLDTIIASISSDETRGMVGCLIIDSLRPQDDEDPLELREGADFLVGMPVPLLLEYLAGVKEANAETFAPFVGMFSGLGDMVQMAKGRLKEKLESTPTPDPEENLGGPESQSDSSDDEESNPQPEPALQPEASA